jgi:hypothetical protein
MGKVHMNKGRAGEDRGSKETDSCPLTAAGYSSKVVTVQELITAVNIEYEA